MTGGETNENIFSSTELLEKNGDSWTLYEYSLPGGLYGLKGVSFNNEVLVSGGSLMIVCLLIFSRNSDLRNSSVREAFKKKIAQNETFAYSPLTPSTPYPE